jgi:hypothetical protein
LLAGDPIKGRLGTAKSEEPGSRCLALAAHGFVVQTYRELISIKLVLSVQTLHQAD